MRESDQLLPAVRVAEIAIEEHAERWLVKSLWGDSSVGVIGGAPKCSKTWLGGVTGDPPDCFGGGDNLGKQKAAFLP